MSPGDRGRVHSLFGAAIDLPPTERSRYLDSRCGDEGAIREAVNGLLDEHDRGSGLLDRPLFSLPPEPAYDVWTGRMLISRYRIERFIAWGGMSAVYLAQDQQLAGRRVIVKFLHAWGPQFACLKNKFRLEMQALARIDHHAVVGVLDTGETADGLPFLVIEYIDGVTLRSEMALGPMTAGRVAALIRQIGRAVAAAHSAGVLHRDLKPENIMLELSGAPEERVRLIDFGIARLEDAESILATTATQFAGTTPYMAPEQLRGKPCPASDIYAMAVVAYEMLAGQRPFPGAGPIEIYEQQRAGAGWTLLMERGVSEAAARLIVRQLAFRPEGRGASAHEVGDAIAAALLQPGSRIWSRRHTMVALAGGGLAAAVRGFRWWTREPKLSDTERVIDLPLPSEPLEHGFRSAGTIENRIIMNSDATAYEALRLISTDQGSYYHAFSRAQSVAANRLGWKMTFEASAEEGSAYAMVDYPHAAFRYSVNLVSVPGAQAFIRLPTAIVPTITGVELPLPGSPEVRHRFTLMLRPPSIAAELWVDGVRYYSGYRGLNDYRYYRGAEIGVYRYRSARGAGVFRSFRFEIG
jgi:Protein kinase domain